MPIKKHKKTNSEKGSALIMLLLMVTIMLTIGTALVSLSFSDYMMSKLYKDQTKAYFAAGSAMEIAARNLDGKVVEAQETARNQTDDYFQNLLLSTEPLPFKNADGSLDIAVLEAMYNQTYQDLFLAALAEPTSFFMNIGLAGNLNLLLGLPEDSVAPEILLEADGTSIAKLLSASFATDRVTIYAAGETLSGQGKTYTKEIMAEYSLLPDVQQIPYQVVPKLIVQNSVKPALLSKALLAEKNIIAAGGVANITGNVLAFGTLPVLNGEEDPDAPWYKYGGIMAGLPDVSSYNMDGSGMSYGTYFGFNTTTTGTAKTGKININGNAATMAYLHTLYSADSTQRSEITAQGDTYAKAVRTEEPAIYSTIEVQDAYITDNLQLDANGSSVNVQGKYHGIVTAGYDIDGSGDITMSGDGEYQYKKTSSIIVNAEATLSLNGTSTGGVYLGGSTFLKNYLATAYYPSEVRPYMTGISALRSGSKVSAAFKQYNALNGETRLYTGNNQYTADAAVPMESYMNITDPDNITAVNMLDDGSGSFTITDRSNHFKWLWEGLWKNDFLYKRYLNTEPIQIAVDPDLKINGFAYGSIVANGQVYAQGDFKGAVDATNFGIMQRGDAGTTGWLEAYHEEIGPLLTDIYSMTAPKLDYTVSTKGITEYIDMVKAQDYTEPTIITVNGSNLGVMSYTAGDCSIRMVGSDWTINGQVLPLNQGIILATGNIYIDSGFNFNGTIMSTKNIIFRGNASIGYNGQLIDEMLADPGVADLFEMTAYATGEDAINAQRLVYNNIKLLQWKKIK